MGLVHCTLVCLGLPLLMACAAGSYQEQLHEGQRQVLANALPVAEVLADPGTDARTRRLLAAALAARDFASRHLDLPDNASYRRYANLGRDYAVWNLFATDEFSLRPRDRCFPKAGCVGYLGFYDPHAARRAAAELQRQGLDTCIGAAAAFTIPGREDAPILSTMLGDEAHQAELIFHELAHQRLYLPGDSAFNESLAVFVQREGLRQWLASRGQPLPTETGPRQREELAALVLATRARLQALYASGLPPEAMRARKAAEFQRLRSEYRQLVARRWGGKGLFDGWIDGPLNNATLLPFALYDQWVPAFAALYRQVDGDWPAFYAQAARLGALPAAQRQAALERLADGRFRWL